MITEWIHFIILTNPAHERGENLKIFGLLGVEEGERPQQKSEHSLQGEDEENNKNTCIWVRFTQKVTFSRHREEWQK